VNPEDLARRVGDRVLDVLVARGEVTAIVGRDDLLGTLRWLADERDLDLGFLSSIGATHWPDSDPAFWVDYELRSIALRHRVRVKVGLRAGDEHLPSVVAVFPTANWHERETFDFFGIVFDGHPDLTRILLPDDWEGFPLRKDEALGGVPTWFRGATMPPIDERGMA
jgi:NADH-quinone oxidoreductase subunit C